ncbi:hypothetical protein F53441_6791 [Fusarium austroafricanum]|uniref:Uncharacterized protein n=1 Tax=Fusarium austroafricanum TaxID=2364996 RepID=A0A8H4KF11_9HYPO|nr:hypothetical protein F53441_6791 [Fusarium austroafricanum]
MSSSPKSSARPPQIEDALEEIEKYKVEVSKLDGMFHECHDLHQKHPDIARDMKNKIDLTFKTILEAEKLIDKVKSRKFRFTKELSKPESNEFYKLKDQMAANNVEVKNIARRLERITESQPADEPGRSSFDLFNPLIEKTIPFTEPYDEDLCDF